MRRDRPDSWRRYDGIKRRLHTGQQRVDAFPVRRLVFHALHSVEACIDEHELNQLRAVHANVRGVAPELVELHDRRGGVGRGKQQHATRAQRREGRRHPGAHGFSRQMLDYIGGKNGVEVTRSAAQPRLGVGQRHLKALCSARLHHRGVHVHACHFVAGSTQHGKEFAVAAAHIGNMRQPLKAGQIDAQHVEQGVACAVALGAQIRVVAVLQRVTAADDLRLGSLFGCMRALAAHGWLCGMAAPCGGWCAQQVGMTTSPWISRSDVT